MSRSRPNRSQRVKDKVDISYEISTIFSSNDAKIQLIERGENEIEVVVGDIPVPSNYNRHRNAEGDLGEESIRSNAVAKWIVSESADIFSKRGWDWDKSFYKSNNPNYFLSDIYFRCSRDEVDDAVMAAKKFITELEEKRVRFSREYGYELSETPSEQLSEN